MTFLRSNLKSMKMKINSGMKSVAVDIWKMRVGYASIVALYMFV